MHNTSTKRERIDAFDQAEAASPHLRRQGAMMFEKPVEGIVKVVGNAW